MSVLIISGRPDVEEAMIRRLISEGDEVRVVTAAPADAERMRALGAHIAAGAGSDADLIERAGQNVRSIVFYQDRSSSHLEEARAVLEAARMLPDVRVIVWGRPSSEALALIAGAGVEHVVLETGGPRRLFGRGPAPDAVATAIDAADDLREVPSGVLDLRHPDGWSALGLPFSA